MLKVKKRNGRLVDFDVEKINICAERACEGLEDVSASELVLDANLEFFDKIQTSEIDQTLILCARSKIYRDYNWSLVAARLQLNCLYKEVFKESVDSDMFEEDYRSAFVKNIKKGAKLGVYNEKLPEIFDLKELSAYLKIERDQILDYVSVKNRYDRYFLRDPDGKVIETPQAFFMRIAMGLSMREEDPNGRAKDLYDVYSRHLASPSTPTLFNSGTTSSQLSSCYLSRIPDSIDGIFDSLKQEARKSKFAGGLGFHVSDIRGAGAYIKGTRGKSSGLVPWLKVYNDMLISCDQAGKRRGSGCAYLEPWHIDVEDFIDLRKETGDERRRTHDLNTALWCPDLFFKRIEEEGDWTLFCPSEATKLTGLHGDKFEKEYKSLEKKAAAGELKNTRTVKAKSLWKKILKSLYETSHPWISFKDRWNERYQNDNIGPLYGSNLCCEISISTKPSKYDKRWGNKTEVGETGVCTLGSVCLANHVIDGELDTETLGKTIKSCVRALDNVLDVNFNPTQEAEKSSLNNRDIGLGSMGWADMFMQMNVSMDSKEAVEIADSVMEFISYCAIKASQELAVERGSFPTYEGSRWSRGEIPRDSYSGELKDTHKYVSEADWGALREKIKASGVRNAQILANAPNASIAYQLSCEQSIEPPFAILFRYENKSGDYYVFNRHFLREMKDRGVWNLTVAEKLKAARGIVTHIDEVPDDLKTKYRTAYELDAFGLINVNAARQKWVCQGISFNLWNNRSSLKYLNDIYLYAYKAGLKSTYYLRNKPANEIALSTSSRPLEEPPATEAFTSADPELKVTTNEAAQACSIEAMQNGGSCEMCEG